MKLTIRKTNLQWSSSLADYAHRRVEDRLSRLRDSVRSAAVRLADVNGPRGGEDKHCRVTARLSTGQDVVVNATGTCPYRVVDDAADRLLRVVKRSRRRRRTAERTAQRRSETRA